MKRDNFILCLTLFITPSVFSFFTGPKNTCDYYENPNLAHLLTGTSDDQQPYSNEDYPNLNVFFNGLEKEPTKDDLLKNLNFGYLNVEQPISSLHDLYNLNSDEIGTPYLPEAKPDPPKVWNVDEVKSLAPPQVLPDVGIDLVKHDSFEVKSYPHVLDEQERKLGRKLVQDTPVLSDVLGVEKSLTQEVRDMGKTELEEKYLRTPEYYQPSVPSVVLNKVVHRKEPSFMDELRSIKKIAMQNSQFNPQVLPYDASDPTLSVVETSTVSPVQENTIEKESNASLVGKSLENVNVVAAPSEANTTPIPRRRILRKRPRPPKADNAVKENESSTTAPVTQETPQS